jgi:hypothetical protein
MNAKQLEHRAGGGQAGITLDSDRGLTLLGQMIASQIGIAKSSSFKSIGDHRVLWQEIAPAMLGPDVRLVLFPHDGMLVTFLLLSASGDTAANTSRLEDTIRTVSFDYKPASASMIVEERSKCDRNDVGSLVRCAGRLAWMGQYSAAAEDLGDVRLLLRSRLPKPKLSDLTATIPAYGISVTNPDPERWKISVLDEGVMEGVLLEDRFSVNGEGIMIGVLDFVTTYGPQVIELLQDEEMKRQMLINGGRGGCMSIGQIERERFAPVRGQLAYEASILPNMAGVKARCQFISGQGCGLMVLVIGASVDFADKTAECDRVVRDCVSAPDLFTENKVVSQLRK